MTTTKEYAIGSYEWNVNTGKPQDGSFTYEEWMNHMKLKTKEWAESFNLEVGQKVKILVGGGEKPLWYTGEIQAVGFDRMNGSYIQLKQKKIVKHIGGWQVSQIKYLSE